MRNLPSAVSSASAPKRAERVTILGVAVDRVTMAEALARIESFLAGDAPRMVVTADAAGIVQSKGDAHFAAILAEADLVTPDSVGVLWAAKRYGLPIAERVSGVELVARLTEASSREGHRIFLLGSAPGVAEAAAERLRLRHPGANIVGARHGYFPPESDEVVAREVADAAPDILLVAMGIPRQEKFIRATREIIRAKVAIGVGGSLDVHSGTVKRAPRVVQRLHLEWLWRTLANPKKIAKARNLPTFVRLVLADTRGRGR